MDPFVIGLVAVSAVLHVAWNVRLKTAGDPLRTATIGMLAASVGIVPAGIVVWALGGRLAAAARRHRARVALGRHRGRLLRPAVGGLPAWRPVGRLSDRPWAPRRCSRSPSASGCSGSGWGSPDRSGVVALLAGFMVLQRPWRVLAAARAAPAGQRRETVDTAILFALATGVTIATYSAIDRVGTRIIDPIPYAAILTVTSAVCLVLWVTFVAGGGIFSGGRDEVRRAAVGGWLTLGAYLADPDRAERGAAVRRRPAARVGDGLRGGLGLGPAGRGERPERGRSAGSAPRSSSSAARCCSRSGADGQVASIGGTRPNNRRRPKRLLTRPTPAMTSAVPMMIRPSTGSSRTR